MFAFLDTEVICWGLLTVVGVLGSILAIKSLFKKKYPNFYVWFTEVEKIFLRNGFALNYLEQLNKRSWEEYYKEGLSPEEAVAEYFE